MKTKHMVALVFGIICIAILSIVLVLSLGKKPEEPALQEEQQEIAVDNPADRSEPDVQTPTDGEEQTPDSTETNEPDEETPDDNETDPDTPVSSDPEPEPPVNNTPETDAEEPTFSANPVDTSTKEAIQKILNDPFMILVNRERKVSSDYVASDLVYFNDYQLNSTCSAALRKMVNAGKSAGYSYILYSGYRTYTSQYNKYYNKIAGYKNNGYSEEEAIRLTDQYYAPPGGSEHHTGLAADVCIPSVVNKYGMLHENYEYTDEFLWFSQNAHKYGFILRYPKGKESITGYNYEPWHYRYVGVDIATEIYNRGLTMEEYVYELESKLAAMN